METYLVIGLGNPGTKYAHTRHNVGFDVVDILAQKLGIRVTRRRAHALTGEGLYEGRRMILAKPQTFMNLSGESIVPLLSWYRLPLDRLVVIYDDVDLAPGTIRVRASGSAGTHNGMRSIIGLIEETGFPRVRVGIGKPPEGWDMADWVTSHYPNTSARKIAFESYVAASEAVLTLVRDGVEAAMRAYNQKKQVVSPPDAAKEDA